MADRNLPSNTVVPLKRGAMAPDNPKILLMVDRMLREHGTSIRRTYLPTLPAIRSMRTPEARAAEVDHHRQALHEMLAAAATEQTLAEIGSALEVALSAEPSEGAVEVSLAALIDSRMRLPHNLPVFVEAAIFDLVDLGFPPSIVAAACQKLRRESVFFPEISEIVAACRETLDRYRDQQRRVTQALTDRRQAVRWLAQLDDPALLEDAVKPAPRRAFDPNADTGDVGWD